MKSIFLLVLLVAALMLAGCAGTAGAVPAAGDSSPVSAANGDLSRVDSQGAVIVQVTPRNLDAPAGELQFDVAMNTHSVDLAMDLAPLSTLTTDTGVTVQASLWQAARGGHHVSGMLAFPSTEDGKPILAGAHLLTLTMRNVDAPARVFTWDLR